MAKTIKEINEQLSQYLGEATIEKIGSIEDEINAVQTEEQEKQELELNQKSEKVVNTWHYKLEDYEYWTNLVMTHKQFTHNGEVYNTVTLADDDKIFLTAKFAPGDDEMFHPETIEINDKKELFDCLMALLPQEES